VVAIEGKGTVLFACKSGEHRRLEGVYYIPRLTTNIVSLGQMDEDGYKINIEAGVLRLYDVQRQLLAKVHRSPSRLYLLDMTIAAPVCLSARVSDMAWRWHERYGHLNFQALRKLGREDMVRGLPVVDHVEQVCEDCVLTKQKRTAFPRTAKYRGAGAARVGPRGPLRPRLATDAVRERLLPATCRRHESLYVAHPPAL
jgi:hypothetical protein